MIEQQAIGAVQAFTNMAQEFGPYLFAILFIIFVPRIAQGYYAACMARTSPPPSESEQKVYRLYFLCSIWVGISVMALAIGWWFFQHAKAKFVYQISINDLSADERVASEYYYRDNPHQTVLPGIAPVHDALFLIVREQPFSMGQTLSFQYVKQPPIDISPGAGPTAPIGRALEPKIVAVKYNGGEILSYRVVNDASGLRLEAAARDDRRGTLFTATEIDAAMRLYASAENSK